MENSLAAQMTKTQTLAKKPDYLGLLTLDLPNSHATSQGRPLKVS